LLKGLYWRRPKETIVSHSERIDPGKRPSILRAPSWSWASVDADIICWHNDNDQEAFVDIISCDIVFSGQNPFGEVSRGVLRLQGYLVEANMFRPNAEQAQRQYRLRLDDKDGYEFARWEADEQDFWIPNVWCIPIRRRLVYADDGLDKSRLLYNRFFGLVLVRTEAKENEYRRVGLFDSDSEAITNEERCEITII
jgi:hypothetical protein